MDLIAHRGLVTKQHKENTIEAFKAAIDSSKYIGFELDIRVTKDNKIVVYHDLLFKGKLVKNCLYKELKKENIPRLIDVLKLETNKVIMIEIKDFNMDLKLLINLLDKFLSRNIYIMSFNTKILKKLKRFKNKLKVGALNYVFNSEEDYSDYEFICIINYLLTDKLVKYFEKQNIEVFAYGIKNSKTITNKTITYIIDDYIL